MRIVWPSRIDPTRRNPFNDHQEIDIPIPAPKEPNKTAQGNALGPWQNSGIEP
jgi:hypothetical protein